MNPRTTSDAAFVSLGC